jgi:hypothetical protein
VYAGMEVLQLPVQCVWSGKQRVVVNGRCIFQLTITCGVNILRVPDLVAESVLTFSC